MTGSATDPVEWQQHTRNKVRREALAKRFKDPEDPLRVVIVRDMWLTGFDAPCLHTMYLDKPMRSHGLMQETYSARRDSRNRISPSSPMTSLKTSAGSRTETWQLSYSRSS